jgi:hypothetical protein
MINLPYSIRKRIIIVTSAGREGICVYPFLSRNNNDSNSNTLNQLIISLMSKQGAQKIKDLLEVNFLYKQ